MKSFEEILVERIREKVYKLYECGQINYCDIDDEIENHLKEIVERLVNGRYNG